jgi:IS605 OrfB family transposase
LPLTKRKIHKLADTYSAFHTIVSNTRETINSSKARTYTQLHHLVYARNRLTSIASQLIEEAQRYAWQRRRICERIRNPTIRFDKRLFSFKATERGHPILSVRANCERLGLPIRQDAAYRRMCEHLGDGWNVTSILMTRRYRFLVLLQKQAPAPHATDNVLGIDQNSNGIGVTVMSGKGRILKQLYLGRKISLQQIRFENRRAKLQEYRDETGHAGKAGLKLGRLSGKQRNYVRTNTWLLAKAITELAERYNTQIAIEHLRNLKRRRGQFSRKSRRKINRIPYGFFRHALSHKCELLGIALVEVQAKYTSQTCPRCGYISRSNRKQWRQFHCVKCGFEANADRVASVNICAERSTLPTR